MSSDIEKFNVIHGEVELPNANILGEVRASTILRDKYVARLNEAVAHGCLEESEYEARIQAALKATTERQLQRLETDLPNLKNHMGKRRDGVYQTAEQWLKVRHNRSMAHIAGFPVLLLITVLGIMIPLDTMPHSTPGNVLAAVFGIIGGVGFIINFIAFFVWADS